MYLLTIGTKIVHSEAKGMAGNLLHHESYLSDVSIFLTFVCSILQKGCNHDFCQLFGSPFSLDLLEAAAAFVCYSELGGSIFRGIDLLDVVGNQSMYIHCIEVVYTSQIPFRRFYCI